MKDKVGRNAERQQREGSQYGYLNLPRGLSMFLPEPKTTYMWDHIPYIVTNPRHPDRDEKMEIATVDELWYRLPFRIHRGIGGAKETVVCLGSIGKRCPICEYRSNLIREGGDPKSDEIKSLRASKRNLYPVIPLDSKDHKQEVHLMDVAQYLFQELLNDELLENEDACMFPDLKEGLTLEVRFKMGKIGKIEFAEASRIDFHPRSHAYDEDILEQVPKLDEGILTILSYAELEAKFYDQEVSETEDDGTETSVDAQTDSDETDDIQKVSKPPMRRQKKESMRKEKDQTPSEDQTNADCPHGHTFGKDCAKYDICDDCKQWDACDEASNSE